MVIIKCLNPGAERRLEGEKMKKEYPENYEVNESRSGYRADGDDFVFEIKENLGILRKSNTGWTRELNIVSWNGSSPKYDIRDWAPDHTKMTRGITLTKEEVQQISGWFQAHINKEEAMKEEHIAVNEGGEIMQ